MQSQIVILSGGHDVELLKIRNEVLRVSGYTVVSAHTAQELIDKFRDGDFDLVLLCHSFSMHEQRVIAQAVREQSPSTPILVIAINESINPFADMLVTNDPVALVTAIKGATSQRFLNHPRGQAS